MAVHAVSDLHIRGEGDPLYHALLNYLENLMPGDTLVLGGDIFDFFVGTKSIFWKRYRAWVDSLSRAVARGVDAHYIEGNHDLYLGRLRKFNVQLHVEEFELKVLQRRFYFAHGDLVDRSDRKYLAYRSVIRSAPVHSLLRVLPEKLLDRLGSRASDVSRTYSEDKMDRFQDVRKAFRNFAAERIQNGFDYVVLGHCHDLDEMKFVVGDHEGHYMNVGFPRVHGTSIVWRSEKTGLERERFFLG